MARPPLWGLVQPLSQIVSRRHCLPTACTVMTTLMRCQTLRANDQQRENGDSGTAALKIYLLRLRPVPAVPQQATPRLPHPVGCKSKARAAGVPRANKALWRLENVWGAAKERIRCDRSLGPICSGWAPTVTVQAG